jgi:hypothetical protein
MAVDVGSVVGLAATGGHLFGRHCANLGYTLTLIGMGRRSTLARHDAGALTGSSSGTRYWHARFSLVSLVIVGDPDGASHVGSKYPAIVGSYSEFDPGDQ